MRGGREWHGYGRCTYVARTGRPRPERLVDPVTSDDTARRALGAAPALRSSTAAPLSGINVVAATAFTIGGSLFALGAAFAQLDLTTLTTVNITYLVGGCFFSLGGYASILLVANRSRA